MSKEIQLSGKHFNKFVLVDDEDFEELSKYTWHFNEIRKSVQAHKNFGYKNNKKIMIHRLIMNANDPKIHVDHINGNVLDNRKSNLRLVSNKTNTRNRHTKLPNTYSKYIGVTLDKRKNLTKRWIAQIKVNYERIHLGRHRTEEEAAIAYNKAAKEYGFLTRNVI